jgi:hypothetical protein
MCCGTVVCGVGNGAGKSSGIHPAPLVLGVKTSCFISYPRTVGHRGAGGVGACRTLWRSLVWLELSLKEEGWLPVTLVGRLLFGCRCSRVVVFSEYKGVVAGLVDAGVGTCNGGYGNKLM